MWNNDDESTTTEDDYNTLWDLEKKTYETNEMIMKD